MPREIGRHSIFFEPPWLLYYILRGNLSADELVGFIAVRDEVASGSPFLLALADLRELGTIPVEARKVAAHRLKRSPYRGTAIFGASLQARTLAKLVLGAARLLGREDRNPVRFFDTEAEARAWLAERAREVVTPAPR